MRAIPWPIFWIWCFRENDIDCKLSTGQSCKILLQSFIQFKVQWAVADVPLKVKE